MKITAALVLAACLAAGASSAWAQTCPAGTYPWTDTWGNRICKRHGDGGTASVEVPRGQNCPTGSIPWTDKWGASICRAQGAGDKPDTDYYDTSKGCPAGTHEWFDKWGAKVCRKF